MAEMFDVIVVGELNVDIILNDLHQLPVIGKEIIANQMNLTLGSSSAIFASNISSLGAKTSFIGRIGLDLFGEVVVDRFRSRKVDTSMIIEDSQHGTGATIVLNVEEDRSMITYPGAMLYLTEEEILDEYLTKGRHLHFSSYYLQPGMRDGLGNLFQRAKKLGLSTSFDMQWDPSEKWDLDIKEVISYVDIFLPNEAELLYLTGKSELISAIEYISPFVKVLAVKKGNKGSIVYHEGQFIELPGYLNKKVVDAIGAGDSFNAGFIYKYLSGASLKICQDFGNLCGAINTTSSGGVSAFENTDKFKSIASTKFGVLL